MFDFQTLLIFFGVITFSFGLMFDSYSFLVKGYVSKENSRVIIAYGNSIQYISRIFFMLTLLIITFSFEQLGNSNALKTIISNGLLIGILLWFLNEGKKYLFYDRYLYDFCHVSKNTKKNLFLKP